MLYLRLPVYLDIEGKHLHGITTETYDHYTDVRVYPEEEAKDHVNTLEAHIMFIVRDNAGNIYKPKETTPIFEMPMVNSIDREKKFVNGYLNIIGNIMLEIRKTGLAKSILDTMPITLGVMEINGKLIYTFELYLTGDNVEYFKQLYDAEVIVSRSQLDLVTEEEELFFKPVIFLDELEQDGEEK